MANIDTSDLGGKMLAAMQSALKTQWNIGASYAKAEAQKLAATAAQIAEGQADGSISGDQATILLRMQANASQAALTAIETIGMIAAQDAINAALDVLKTAVNKAVGFAFL